MFGLLGEAGFLDTATRNAQTGKGKNGLPGLQREELVLFERQGTDQEQTL